MNETMNECGVVAFCDFKYFNIECDMRCYQIVCV